MNKKLKKEFSKVLKMTAKNPQQWSGVSSVELNDVEVWADELTADDIREIENELGGKYQVKSRITDLEHTELYLEKNE